MSFSNPQELGRPITVKDEGVTIATNVGSFDFTGAGVSGSAVGSAVTEDIDGGGGGGVSDGDKGDITVSASGATWTIDNDVVTYAKMQNVSAEDKILGRITASAGNVEELTAANVRTIINVADGATAYTDELAQDAVGGILTDSSEIDFTYNDAGPTITASLIASSIDETKLDASVNASLDLADTALQSGDVTDATINTNADVLLATTGITIDGGGSVITTGIKGFIEIPYNATILGWTLLSTDASVTGGAIVVDIWKDTYANYPPTVADTITAADKPTISATSTKGQGSSLTGWTTSITAGDILGFKVDSVTSLTKVTLILKLRKT
jgi:hypothetical protein